jgi:hypothetical protein
VVNEAASLALELDIDREQGERGRLVGEGARWPRIGMAVLPAGAGTGSKICRQARVRAQKSARGQLTSGNYHPRIYPIPG